jgi:hypothetical protein
MAIIDAEQLAGIFAALGDALARPASLCLIGSTPGIMSGQPGRQTADIDVWHAASDYDAGDLARACRDIGLLYDPREELEAGAVYIQVVRPGIVRLPTDFDLEVIGTFGRLRAVMPPPAILVAAKLVRGTDTDIHDVAWWVRDRDLRVQEVAAAIQNLPDSRGREAAAENLTFVRLIRGDS